MTNASEKLRELTAMVILTLIAGLLFTATAIYAGESKEMTEFRNTVLMRANAVDITNQMGDATAGGVYGVTPLSADVVRAMINLACVGKDWEQLIPWHRHKEDDVSEEYSRTTSTVFRVGKEMTTVQILPGENRTAIYIKTITQEEIDKAGRK